MADLPIYSNGVRVAFSKIDDDLYEYLTQWVWYQNREGYAVRRRVVENKTVTVYLHHLVLPPKPGLILDHREGDRLDNRRASLRYVTRQQNNQNSGSRSHSNSRIKGVRQVNLKWKAAIQADGKVHYLGYFYTAYDAAQAYNKAALRLHGEYARLNDLEAVGRDPKLNTPSARPPTNRRGVVKGVYWFERGSRWLAQPRGHYMGYYDDLADAIGAVETFYACS